MGAKRRAERGWRIDRDDRWWEETERFPPETRLGGFPGGPQGVWTELSDGTRHGRYTHFHAGGGKAGEQIFERGIMRGPVVGWYPNGRIQATGAYLDDAPDGEWTFYREDGSVLRVDTYDRGELVGSVRHGTATAQRDETLARLVHAADHYGTQGAVARPLADLVGWFRDRAPPYFEAFTEGAAAVSERDRAQVEELVGPLPADFLAYLDLAHGESRLAFFEYSSFNLAHMAQENEQQTRRHADVTDPAPRLAEGGPLRNKFWHSGWLPFAGDGGGNLICIDLDPAPGGRRGQVFYWDSITGPQAPVARSFLAFLASYREKLLGGGYRYDPDSGAFDRVRGR